MENITECRKREYGTLKIEPFYIQHFEFIDLRLMNVNLLKVHTIHIFIDKT